MKRIQDYHCSHFDTALLAQVIATDVDNAVRRIRREKGVIIEPAMCRSWVEAVMQEIESSLQIDRDAHMLMPEVLQQRISRAIERFVSGQ